MGFRIGIDVGGTFTDLYVVSPQGCSSSFKVSSTHPDPTPGLFAAFLKAAQANGITVPQFLESTDLIVHGTTVTVNALLTGRGAKTGLITTKGFRDVLEMRQGIRDDLYNNKVSPPKPLVERRLRVGVRERVDYAGRVTEGLELEEVGRAVELFRQAQVEALAVCFLFSYLNPAHEEQVKAFIEGHFPEAYLSVSSEVHPEVRFYQRLSTTVLNSYVGPVLARYLANLERLLKENQFRGTLLIMQSNGGVMTARMAGGAAVHTLLSGPAAGPVAANFCAGPHHRRDLISMDMGGTSFDVCLIKDGSPHVTREAQVAGHRIASPIIDIHTIGAGGGSIAWADSGGLLRVGPQSAGADPGPVCYGLGGAEPTVTDADLVLGFLNPDYFLGGTMKIDKEASLRAIERLGKKVGLDPLETALGIYHIVNSNMADALRLVSIRKGYDPREFSLVVAGGAGPVHAAAVSLELQIPTLLIPADSSVFCAKGMLLSDLRCNFGATYKSPVNNLHEGRVAAIYADLRRKAEALLKAQGEVDREIQFTYGMDLRYVGQFHEVELALPGEDLDLSAIVASFHKRHEELFGYHEPDARVELINLRLEARGITRKPELTEGRAAAGEIRFALKGGRSVYFGGGTGAVETPVYDGRAFARGHLISGPAILERPDTTVVVPPGFRLSCDRYGNYIVERIDGGG